MYRDTKITILVYNVKQSKCHYLMSLYQKNLSKDPFKSSWSWFKLLVLEIIEKILQVGKLHLSHIGGGETFSGFIILFSW